MSSNEILNTNNLLKKWEPLIDTASFVGAGALSCAIQSISFISPMALGTLAVTGASALSSAILGKVLPQGDKRVEFLKLVATIVVIAAITFTMPYVSAAIAIPTAIVMTHEVAITLGLLTILAKIASYTAVHIRKTPTQTPTLTPKEASTKLYNEGLPPEDRTYIFEDLPEIDVKELPRPMEEAQAKWVHLYHQLGPKKDPIDPLLAQEFHRHRLPPVGDEWFDMGTLDVQMMTDVDYRWAYNFMEAKPADLAKQPEDVRRQLLAAFKALNLMISEQEQPVVRIEESSSKKVPDRKAFQAYVQKHCPGVDFAKAKKQVASGLLLLGKFHSDEEVEPENHEEKLRQVCWALMFHAVQKGQGFTQGTFDLADPGHRIFDFFQPMMYGRSSSHYKTRALAITDGEWMGYKHFGFDLGALPAQKQTVMMGRIATRDGSSHTYLKMEDFGANLNFYSDPSARAQAHQVAYHTLDFFRSQAKRNAPSVFGEVGDGELMRKEHMLRADQDALRALKKEIDQKVALDLPFENDFGFQDAIPYFRKAVRAGLPDDTIVKIREFLLHIKERGYDHVSIRRGDEVQVGTSYLDYALGGSLSQSTLGASDLGTSFVEMTSASEDEGPKVWEMARNALLSADRLGSTTLIAYHEYLQAKHPRTSSMIGNFLFPGIVEEYGCDLAAKMEEISAGEKIFIPLILENPYSKLPFVGGYIPDHIVMVTVDRENQTIEYYDPRGGNADDEQRTVLGYGQSFQQILGELKAKFQTVVSNDSVHQNDTVNCGTAICWFMRERQEKEFNAVCAQEVNLSAERRTLARELQLHHAPPELQDAIQADEVIARLKREPERVTRMSLNAFLKEEMAPYMQNGEVNRERLIGQVNLDIPRTPDGHFVNGQRMKSAQEILEHVGNIEYLSLLQQGVFARLQLDIQAQMDLLGMDAVFAIRASGCYIKDQQTNGTPILTFRANPAQNKIELAIRYEFYATVEKPELVRDKPYGVIRAEIDVDLARKTVTKSWRVEEIIQPPDAAPGA